MRRLTMLAIAVLLAAAAFSTTAGGAAKTKTIRLSGTSFSKSSIKIRKKDRIRFVWVDGQHDVTRVSGPHFVDTGLLDAPTTALRTFKKAGVYHLVCAVHADLGMKITVTVTG